MKNYYVNGWTDSQERRLAEIMTTGLRRGERVNDLLRLAGKEIGRSHKSCMNRWYDIRHMHLKEIV